MYADNIINKQIIREVSKTHFFFHLQGKGYPVKSLQVGVHFNLLGWFQLCSKKLNPCDHQKGPPSGEGINTHTLKLDRENQFSKTNLKTIYFNIYKYILQYASLNVIYIYISVFKPLHIICCPE